MKKKSLKLSEVYRLIEPGPVVLVTTSHKGRSNIMAMSWHTMMEFEPPIIGCIISNRNFSYLALTATQECVLNIPTSKIISRVVACGNTSGRKTNKFKDLRLTPVPASRVAPPLIKECYANLECKVIDTTFEDKYNFFVLEVIKAWIDRSIKHARTIHHMGRGTFMIGGKTVRLQSKKP